MIQQTSYKSFQTVKPVLGERQQQVYDLLVQYKNLTNTEIADKIARPINVVTPRVKELRDMGLVAEWGKRECTITRRTVIAWAIIRETLF